MMTTTERIAKAEALSATLRATIDDRKFAPRVWSKGDHVRLYTGLRAEYLSVEADGSVQRSQSRMAWGEAIDSAIA